MTFDHKIVSVTVNGKKNTLKKIIKSLNINNAIIFCNRKKDIDVLAISLQKSGLNARALHGDMAQNIRSSTLSDFKKGMIAYLVSSDVTGRGIDIDNVSHVFNYDVPIHAEDYVHRIGRTGRAGKKGTAFTLVTNCLLYTSDAADAS